jgi:hypothetical protein
MSRPLSYRRAQENRALHKAYYLVHDIWQYHKGHRPMTLQECWDFSRRLAKNRKPCSGQCCKNPRRTKWHEITFQEKRALEDYISQLEEINIKD